GGRAPVALRLADVPARRGPHGRAARHHLRPRHLRPQPAVPRRLREQLDGGVGARTAVGGLLALFAQRLDGALAQCARRGGEAGDQRQRNREQQRGAEGAGEEAPVELHLLDHHLPRDERTAGDAEHASDDAGERVLDREERGYAAAREAEGLEEGHLAGPSHRARCHRAEEDGDAGERHEAAEEAHAEPEPPEDRGHFRQHLSHVDERDVGKALREEVLHAALAAGRQAGGGEAALRRLLQHAGLDDDEEVDAEGAPVDGAQAGDDELDGDALHVEDDVRAEMDAELAGVLFFEAHLVVGGVAPQLAGTPIAWRLDEAVVGRQRGEVGEALLAGEGPAALAVVAAFARTVVVLFVALAGGAALAAASPAVIRVSAAAPTLALLLVRPPQLSGDLLDRHAVDAGDARHHHRHRLDGGGAFAFQQRLDAGPLIGLHVDEEGGRRPLRQLGLERGGEVALDERGHQHHENAEPHRDERRQRVARRPREERRAVA